jgi:hypothetical protein
MAAFAVSIDEPPPSEHRAAKGPSFSTKRAASMKDVLVGSTLTWSYVTGSKPAVIKERTWRMGDMVRVPVN